MKKTTTILFALLLAGQVFGQFQDLPGCYGTYVPATVVHSGNRPQPTFAILPEPEAPVSGKYKINRAKVIGWTSLVIGGFVDGALEGYQFDSRKSFERKWGKDPYGFWGSESWRMIYNEGNPQMGVKSKLHDWLGATDFYHVADDTRKVGYIGGGISLGIGGCKVNKKWWHWALDIGITSIVSSSAKSLGMKLVRN